MKSSSGSDHTGSSLNSLNLDKVSALIDRASRLGPEERKEFLDQACEGAPALREELESLLKIKDQSAPDKDIKSILYSSFVAQSPIGFLNPSQLSPGQIVGHYEILEKIGEGGMGIVYKALDTKLKRLAALKFLPGYLHDDTSSRQRFIQEARSASSLDHPNICTVYEINELEHRATFIAMAYYDGITLKKLIEKGALPIEKSIDVTLQVGAGLMQAHNKGIVHRDVKPANIILTSDNIVKILDFGIAKSTDSSITKTGDTIGTVSYMAPEQAKGGTVDHRVDLWALGVVLYEMLTGQRPFEGEHSHAVIYSILNRDPQPVTGLRTGIPLQLAHIVQKLLSKSIEHRYQQVDRVLVDLRSIQDRNAARISAEGVVLSRNEDQVEAVSRSSFSMDQEEGNSKILFVDDEPEFELLIRNLFRHKAKANRWSLEFATSGKEALERLAVDSEIALVLTDLNMPEMDGLMLLDHIHQLKRPLKTIIVTAYSDIKNIRAAMNRGAFDFVVKPIVVDDLETTIRKSLNEWHKEQKAAQSERQLVAIQKELDVARQIQEAIQPVGFESNEQVDIYAFSMSAHEISGTFYDYYWVDDQRVGFLIGDVGGKGVSAAVSMAMIQTFFKSIALQGQMPGRCMTLVNRLLVPEGFPGLSVTVFYGLFDSNTGDVLYCNAGHQPPYMMRRDGTVGVVSNDIEIPVWSQHGYEYKTNRFKVERGESLFLFTRGLPEAQNQVGGVFSPNRLEQMLKASLEHTSTELVRTVIRTVLQFTEDVPLKEDLTVLTVQRR